MKKFFSLFFSVCIIAFLMMTATSCGSDKKTNDEATDVTEMSTTDIDDDLASDESDDYSSDWDDEDMEEEGEEAEESSSTTDWDQLLDDYEDYVDEYIALMKKTKNGDMSAMSEYASMLEKAQSIQSQLENGQDEMTAAQAARMSRISAKMAKAAM